MPIPFPFNFKNPDYTEVFKWREERLIKIRKDPKLLQACQTIYKNDPAQFIIDWGVTYDPRNIDKGRPALVPFLLFSKQEDFVHWVLNLWKSQSPGLADKSRDMGLSWLIMALAVSIGLFNDDVTIGAGSRKEEYVDKSGDPKCLFHKARQFLRFLPVEFKGGWDLKNDAHMRIFIPDKNAVIVGEAGDNLGRGGRTSLYIVDESAHIARPHLIDASLSETTNCRIDISTPRGMGNPFARKRHGGKISVFTFHWRDDPRKDDAWYQKKCRDLDDPVVIAQELDLDYAASVEGVVIESAWIQAAIDAHIKLGIDISGERKIGLDIADEGKDKNAVVAAHGILIEYIEEWSGKNSDIYATVERACSICDVRNYPSAIYDADGLGAAARGDSRKINSKRTESGIIPIEFIPYRGSGEVVNPEHEVFPRELEDNEEKTEGRKNKDFFANAKAQAWWSMRRRFQLTYRAVVEGREYNPDTLISISSSMQDYQKLVAELSQPTFSQNSAGKLIINKKPDGVPSPNMADAAVIRYAPRKDISLGWFDVDI